LVTVIRAMRLLSYRVHVRRFSDTGTYFTALTAPGADAQAGFGAWGPDYPGPGGFMTPLVGCKGQFNLSHFCDPGVDAAIRRAGRLALTDPQAAGEQWARLDRRVTDLAPAVPLLNPTNFNFVGARVGNYQDNPQWYALLDQLWVR
jgi:ABC-type transport system substrate-binding protein